MRLSTLRPCILGVMICLAGCGGDSSTTPTSATPPAPVPPAPVPPAPPPPAPPPFPAVAGAIFADTGTTSMLSVTGRGWTWDYIASGTYPVSNIRDAGGAAALYDPASGTYRLTVPSVGSGTLFQSEATRTGQEGFGQVYAATIAASVGDVATSALRNSLLILASRDTGTLFKDTSWVAWYNDRAGSGASRTGTIGVFGIARASPASALLAPGQRRYMTRTLGYLEANASDYLTGNGTIDIDFAQSKVSGSVDIVFNCMMGCSYPSVRYQIANVTYAPGDLSLSGQLVTAGSTTAGTFTGIFAGPGAREIMISFEIPALDPNFNIWKRARGVTLGRIE